MINDLVFLPHKNQIINFSNKSGSELKTLSSIFKISHRECSMKKGVLKNFCKIHKITPVPKSLI